MKVKVKHDLARSGSLVHRNVVVGGEPLHPPANLGERTQVVRVFVGVKISQSRHVTFGYDENVTPSERKQVEEGDRFRVVVYHVRGGTSANDLTKNAPLGRRIRRAHTPGTDPRDKELARTDETAEAPTVIWGSLLRTSPPMHRPSLVWVFVLPLLLFSLPLASAIPSARPVAAAPSNLVVGFLTDASALPVGVATRTMPSTALIDLTLTLAPRNSAELSELVEQLSNPTSDAYRHFLTEPEFVEQFAPAPRELAGVESILAQMGGHSMQSTPDRLGVTTELTASTINRMFQTHLVEYRSPSGRWVYTPSTAPILPGDLAGLVTGAGGFSNLANQESAVAANVAVQVARPIGESPRSFVTDPSTGDQWFVGSDFTQAYGVSGLFPSNSTTPNASFGTGEAIATLLASAYNQTNDSNLPPWDPVVVQEYFNDTLPSWWPKPNFTGIPVSISGYGTPPLPGYFGGTNDSTSDEFENSLDLEMAGSLAPGAALYNFYVPGSVLVGTPPYSDIADDLAQGLAAALSYSYGTDQLAAVSASFGVPDLNDSLWDTELLHAAAIGTTVLAASGDAGNAPNSVTGGEDGQWPTWPASAAFATSGDVAVGGTEIQLLGSPAGTWNGTELNASFDPTAGTILSQTAWYETSFGAVVGSEGGISAVYSEPSWQAQSAAQPAIVNATILQGAGALGRAEPDIAFVANSTIAYVARDPSGTYFSLLAGTSIASPVFAGMLAVLAGVSHHLFGYLDPELYRIASYYSQYPGSGNPFEDITQGANYVFSTGPGWDATTGWGSINPTLFLAADSNPTIRNYTYSGPEPTLPPSPNSNPSPLSIDLLVIIFGIALVVAVTFIIVFGRTKQPAAPPAPPPSGSYGWPTYGDAPPPPPSPPPLASGYGSGPPLTMACPYCGAPRSTEAIPCPYCGRL